MIFKRPNFIFIQGILYFNILLIKYEISRMKIGNIIKSQTLNDISLRYNHILFNKIIFNNSEREGIMEKRYILYIVTKKVMNKIHYD